MSLRTTTIERKTKEVDIKLSVNLDGTGISEINTSIPFLDHLLVIFTQYSRSDLQIVAQGDLQHHIVEDIAICLGSAINALLEDKTGLTRYSFEYIAMDDSLARAVVDIGGRPYFRLDLNLDQALVEGLAKENIEHFLETFALLAKITLHLEILYGKNDHHKIEAGFKALAQALRKAVTVDPTLADQIKSTKGVL